VRDVSGDAGLLPGLLNPDSYTWSWAQLPHFVAALAILGAAAAVWRAERGSRIGRLFVIFSALFGIWVAGRGLIHMQDDPQAATQLARNLFAISSVALPLLLRIIAVILMREREQNAFITLNWFVALIFALASFNTPWFIEGVHVFSWGLEPAFGTAGYLYMAWVMGLMGYVSFELYRAHRLALPGSLERRRVRWFAVAVFMLYVGVFEFFSAMGLPVYPVGGLGVVGFSLLVAYITQRFGLVQITAQLAAEQIIDMVRGGLLVVDQDGLIRLFSNRAGQLLGLARAQVVGKPAHLFLGDALRPPALSRAARHADGEGAETEISYLRPRSHGAMPLALSVSAVHDRRGQEVAFACLLRDLSEARRSEQERERERLTDTATGLPNRTMFLALLDAATERCNKDPAYRFSVCAVGIDRIREMTESHCYAAGDALISAAASRLRGASRPQDAVARVGDGEFAVLVRGLAAQAEVDAYVRNLRSELQTPVELDAGQVDLKVHVGTAIGGGGACNGAELLRSAGAAMHRHQDGPLAGAPSAA
jgi:diguanylate cyclase (GGDEF)-like protein/PAS domain S-box-containing protein